MARVICVLALLLAPQKLGKDYGEVETSSGVGDRVKRQFPLVFKVDGRDCMDRRAVWLFIAIPPLGERVPLMYQIGYCSRNAHDRGPIMVTASDRVHVALRKALGAVVNFCLPASRMVDHAPSIMYATN